MFKKLQSLFSEKPHPCMQWPEMELSTPAFRTADQQIGDLKFGAPLDGAMQFGAPDQVEPGAEGSTCLVYAKAGFLLEFDKVGLISTAYFVGHDDYTPPYANLRHCTPVIDSHLVTSEFGPEKIQELFGVPKSVDQDEDETILFYEGNGLTTEFEFNQHGRLKRVNMYT